MMATKNAEGIGSDIWGSNTGNAFGSSGGYGEDGVRADLLSARLERQADDFVAHVGRCDVCLTQGAPICREGDYMIEDAENLRTKIAAQEFDRRPRRKFVGPFRSGSGLPGFFTVIDPARAVEPGQAA